MEVKHSTGDVKQHLLLHGPGKQLLRVLLTQHLRVKRVRSAPAHGVSLESCHLIQGIAREILGDDGKVARIQARAHEKDNTGMP